MSANQTGNLVTESVDHPAAVDERGEDLLIPLLRSLHQDSQRSEGGEDGEEIPERDDGKHGPGGPVGEVLDEDESHQRRDEDKVTLLQQQRRLPVDGQQPHHAEVPDEDGGGDVVQGQVVRLQHLGQVEVGEEEEQHQARHKQPAVDEFGAPVLVRQHQQRRHHGDHGEHDAGIGEGLPHQGARVVRLLVEGCVDQVGALLGVVGDGGDGGHHHRHAQRHRAEQFDDVVRAVLEVQLLLHDLGLLLLRVPRLPPAGCRLLLG